jgi:hypothetical protein
MQHSAAQERGGNQSEHSSDVILVALTIVSALPGSWDFLRRVQRTRRPSRDVLACRPWRSRASRACAACSRACAACSRACAACSRACAACSRACAACSRACAACSRACAACSRACAACSRACAACSRACAACAHAALARAACSARAPHDHARRRVGVAKAVACALRPGVSTEPTGSRLRPPTRSGSARLGALSRDGWPPPLPAGPDSAGP